ncbi:MAG: glycine cleavage system aminomethyltransferase GcvT [Prevotellaceae bacterium]|jgi:aminomethyltransferase|nr:glycine cleavage system aminomethyltransferase GcvT [Prevotellaceae bacterium]
MRDTAFTKYHVELGAKMAPFAGFNMPIEYSGIIDEHIAVREKVGVFDVSHMGEFWVKGPDALAFLQYVTTNDVAALTPGKIQYSCFPNGKGGIVDDLLVYCIDQQTYLLVVNAGNMQKDWEHLCSYAGRFGLTVGKDLYDASSEIALLAVQGPKAIETIQKITEEPIGDIPYYSFRKANVAGIENAILSVTGYTGAGGCEIYIANEDAPKLWNAVFEAGKEFGIKPAGLGARDTLRLEMGFCLYGNDITDETSPLEAGLGWIVKFKDDKDFVDKDRLLKQKAEGVKVKLINFDLIDRGVPRQHYEICNREGEKIGETTSGTMSPSRKVGIGMGYVATEYSTPGTEIFVKIRERLLKAKVVKRTN